MNPQPSIKRSHLLDSAPLFEFSTLVNSTLDLKFILGSVLLTLMAKLRVTKSLVLLKTGEGKFRIENCKGVGSELLRKEIRLARPPKKDFAVSQVSSPAWKTFYGAGIERIFPIVSHGKVLGYFGIGGRMDKGQVSAREKEFVDIFINVAASAIDKGIAFQELRSVNRTLDGKIQELKTLFELSKEFTAVIDRERLLKLFGFTLMGQIGVNRFAVCLKDGGVFASRLDTSALLTFEKKIFSLVTSPMRVADFPKRKSLAAPKSACEAAGITAIIPLQSQNEVKGIVCLGERLRGGGYSQADLEFVYSIGNLAIISLENSRLFNEAIEKQKLEDELTIAREIQNGLLPKSLPEIPGFQIAALNSPSKQVGGDYYDLLLTKRGKLILAIGDVSGKGTPASLLMANVQATIRALVPFDLPLAECTARVNDLLFENTGANKFITFFWGALDPVSRSLRYVNAGHNHPFVLRANGTVKRLGEGGLLLGIMKALAPYQEGSVKLETGDTLVLFTDGVSEAMDNEGNEYTEERLEAFLRTVISRTPQEIVSAVQEDVARHVSGAPQSDDITLVVAKAV
ncbi:MAG: PP2C family protein-serine/threonine phosphatase [Bacteroidota bacterium]|nr:PP2C family protein-serine/threonine phosphatase [Bacteroidota bacterium]